LDLDIDMNKLTIRKRNAAAGEGLVVVIILVALLGIGAWWLFSTKASSDKEARAFGREFITRLAVNYDQAYFAANLSPQARLENPPSRQAYIIGKLKEFGTPAQPIPIEESVTFESKFFSPRGYFNAKLNYPGQAAAMQIAISHPVGKWQVDNIEMVATAQR